MVAPAAIVEPTVVIDAIAMRELVAVPHAAVKRSAETDRRQRGVVRRQTHQADRAAYEAEVLPLLTMLVSVVAVPTVCRGKGGKSGRCGYGGDRD